ncbi:restriction endonuclease subunit S [Tenacibaculum dicentrarchi]|uniref:restriction endonuclease subunit S n=1 Tax=Tenacibaculum dicentrarchi TaxID=669041 RepID=UPI0035194C00
MDTKNLIPKLRFPEFNYTYDNILLKNNIEILSGYAFKSKYFGKTGSKLAIPKNFTKNGFGNFSEKYSKYTTEVVHEKYICKEGDLLILLTDLTQSCELLGKPLLIKKEDGKVLLNQRVIKVTVKKKLNNNFLMYQLLTDTYHKRIKETSSGTTVRHSSNQIINNINLNIPQLPEQEKIASFLTEVDSKLTQLTKKKALLENYKKGVMQKIFNQKIRFKDNKGNKFPNWKEKTLGEVATFLKGKGLPKTEINKNSKYKCIHYGELFTKYDEKINNIISRTNYNDKKLLSIENDVLMPTSDVTPNGLATASCLNESNIILGGDILIIRQKIKIIEGVYLAYYIKNFRKDVMKLVSGSTVYHLYGSDMKNLKLKLPCLEEQEKIANFLSEIDNKIKTLNTKIENNKSFKKGLLQKMFV